MWLVLYVYCTALGLKVRKIGHTRPSRGKPWRLKTEELISLGMGETLGHIVSPLLFQCQQPGLFPQATD